jgi:hypothetical protein
LFRPAAPLAERINEPQSGSNQLSREAATLNQPRSGGS